MAKTLCDWSKHDIERDEDKLRSLTCDSTHYCRKCARTANTPKVLCKPRKFRGGAEKSPD